MSKGRDKSRVLANWGTSLLNKLSALARNRRKRDASKRRRQRSKDAVREGSDD